MRFENVQLSSNDAIGTKINKHQKKVEIKERDWIRERAGGIGGMR